METRQILNLKLILQRSDAAVWAKGKGIQLQKVLLQLSPKSVHQTWINSEK